MTEESTPEIKIGEATVKVAHPSILNVLKKREHVKQQLSKVKHRIGVWSAKGGVGKTTVSINLAYTLMRMGYKVGILDADIDCPNVCMFLGITDRQDGNFPLKPAEKDGIRIISTAMYVDDTKRPIMWRGPLIAKMVSDFLENSDWGELDYLIIDIAPGTSDEPLSIMQLLDIDGFILVTGPQHIASANTIKSGLMAKRMSVHIVGVVENMSNGSMKGAEEVADALDCKLLGKINYSKKFDEMSDSGKVPVEYDTEIKEEFISIAKKLIE